MQYVQLVIFLKTKVSNTSQIPGCMWLIQEWALEMKGLNLPCVCFSCGTRRTLCVKECILYLREFTGKKNHYICTVTANRALGVQVWGLIGPRWCWSRQAPPSQGAWHCSLKAASSSSDPEVNGFAHVAGNTLGSLSCFCRHQTGWGCSNKYFIFCVSFSPEWESILKRRRWASPISKMSSWVWQWHITHKTCSDEANSEP